MISEGSVLFSMPKFYQYANPNLTVEREGDELLVRAEKYAGSVELLNEMRTGYCLTITLIWKPEKRECGFFPEMQKKFG